MTQASEPGVSAVAARRQYRHPPIEEALCEIRFVPSTDWDPTVPGVFYQSIKPDYPAKPRTQNVLEAGVTLPDAAGTDGPSFQFRQNASRVQFRSADERRIVGVGPDVLSIHILRPYSSWETFREQIQKALDAYVSVAEPAGILRIGVRYINRIVVAAEVVELNEYFTSPPEPPDSLPQSLRSFLVRMDAVYESEPVRLVTTFASNSADEGQTAFILDIDVVAEPPDAVSIQEAMGIIDDLRAKERAGFESLITNKAREVFDAD